MKKVLIVLFLLIVAGSFVAWHFYTRIFNPATNFESDYVHLYIPTGSTFDDVLAIIEFDSIVADIDELRWVAEKKDYPNRVKAGRYRIEKGESNSGIINLLRSGRQEAVTITFPSVRTMDQLAGKLAKNIEPDSAAILSLLTNPATAAQYGFDKQTFSAMFIPNSYNVYWNTSAEGVIERMADEFKKFWNDERLTKARTLGLSQSEVVTLASIVNAETAKRDEAPVVAGVYVNRIKQGIPLQADPTLIFALGDFSITRVLDKHKEIESPYNTYKYAGLPPGPINLPDGGFIDAVLNYQKHDYIYFCAKADFSGYHNFSKTLRQHNAYANEYRRALNNRGIYR
jgi:UPF0755 protein